ncbi:MAG: sigma-70 family RNA polymerase sigma factor [Bacteroidota bacterium]
MTDPPRGARPEPSSSDASESAGASARSEKTSASSDTGTEDAEASADRAMPTEERALYSAWCTAIRNADVRAFESLFRATHGGLLRFAERLVRDADVASDLTQEAYARLWERRGDLDPTRSVKALLYRTVRNLAYNRARDRRTRADLLAAHAAGTPLATGISPAPLPDAEVNAAALDHRLRHWIDALPERQRETIRLSRFEGLSHAEIAAVMGVSPRTVNNHLVQALRTLRDRLHEFAPSLLDR